MATILNIETSTDTCSAALTDDGAVLCHREDFGGRNHAALLSLFVKDSKIINSFAEVFLLLLSKVIFKI